jgi:lipoprotein-anchoring transpeptidase ErfK/SrfK
MRWRLQYLLSILIGLSAAGCVSVPTNQSNNNLPPTPSPGASVSPSPVNGTAAKPKALTLPVLDAFFADEGFSALLKSRLHVSDEQIARLKELAHAETAKLDETNAGKGAGETAAARASAEEKISEIIGDDKAAQLAALVGERWNSTDDASNDTAANSGNQDSAKQSNGVPNDSRIVVNTPAYRMDVFDSGRLVKSYKIGIGYPQFPLPTGKRKANVIIFNPTWTPPDEPWVAKMKNVSAGEKVEAGSKFNPLGPIKIPIGGPSLIHGGKSPAKLGTFASHGCVGLTTPQVKDFAKLLAQLGGTSLTDEEVAGFGRDKTQTKQMKLAKSVPVELRYETIVVEDGKLHIYRDVYDEGTNTEENLRSVLEASGVKLEDLTDSERAQVLDALAQMSRPAGAGTSAGKPSPSTGSASSNSNSTPEKKAGATKKPNRGAGSQKEIVIEIAVLKGKGYPAPADLDTGSGKTKAAVSK